MEAVVATGEQVVVYAPAATQWAAVKLGMRVQGETVAEEIHVG